ncbi:MAG TPA: GNAT family N-acetyltransferase [Longimicrobium sp.]|nr:GNAT family N-acetyltransferase [Longimicrobium sp.]
MQSPFLVGQHVYLRPHQPSDVDSGWYQWFNDPDVTRFMRTGSCPGTREQQAAFYADVERRQAARSHLQLAVVHRETDTFMGVVSLANIDWVNRAAEIGLVIGRAELRGRGSGLECMALLVHHGFAALNLNRIYGEQHVGLERWKNALVRHLAFVEEGVLRQALFKDGCYNDMVAVSVLAGDWWRRWDQAGRSIAGMIGTSAADAPGAGQG